MIPKVLIIIAAIILPVIILASSIAANYGLSFYTIEAESYIPHYLSDKPLSYKLFNFVTTDGYFRSRHLTTLVHWLDTQLLVLSLKLGHPHFLSPIYYFMLIILIGVFWKALYSKFNILSFLISLPATAAFLLTPAIFYSGMYFRPSKMLTALIISIILIRIWKQRSDAWITVLIFFSALADELGVAYGALIMGYITLRYLETHQKSHLKTTLYILAGIGLYAFYRSYVSPYLTERIIGFAPSPWSMSNSTDGIRISPSTSFSIYMKQLSYFFGTIPQPLLVFPLACIYFLLSKKQFIRSTLLIVSFTLFYMVILYIMAMTLSTVIWTEYSIIYYPIPLYVFLYSIIIILSANSVQKEKKVLYPISLLLSIWAIANALAVNTYPSVLLDPKIWTSENYGEATIRISALQHPEIPIKSTGAELYIDDFRKKK